MGDKKNTIGKCKYANGIKKINELYSKYPTAIRLSRELTRIEKDIMLLIFNATEGGSNKMPNNLIAFFCDCAENTVSIAISRLTKLGYVSRMFHHGARYLSVTKENLGHMWDRELDNIIKWLNGYIMSDPIAYEEYIEQKTKNNQMGRKNPDDIFSVVKRINERRSRGDKNEDFEEEIILALDMIQDLHVEEPLPTQNSLLPTQNSLLPTQNSPQSKMPKNNQISVYDSQNPDHSGAKPSIGLEGERVLPRRDRSVSEKSREPTPIAESRDFEKSRDFYTYREISKDIDKEKETSLSKERLCVSSFSKEKKESASEPAVRDPEVELKKNPGGKDKTSSERIMPIDDDPPESEDFLREQYADYLRQLSLKANEDNIVEDEDFLAEEYSTFCQQLLLQAETDKDPVPDDDDSPYYNHNRPAPLPPRKLSKEEEWAKWHLTPKDKEYIEKRRLERLREEAEAKAKREEEKKKFDEEEDRLARMTPEEQWEEIYGKREDEYKNAVLSAYARDLPEWIEKNSRMYRHLFKKEYVPTQEDIDLFRAKLKSNQMNENNGNGKHPPKKNIPKIGLIDPNYVEIDEDCREIIDYWEKMGFPKVREKDMKRTVENIRMFLNGTMKKCLPESLFEGGYHSFSKEQIIQAINNRHIKAFNDEYMPTEEFKKKMRRTTLQSWFYIPGNVPIPSPFLYDLANKPWKNKNAGKEQIQDVNPAFTKLIKKKYAEKVIGIEPEKWSFEDEKRFRLATKRFEDFRKKNAGSLDPLILNPPTVDSVASLFFHSVGSAVDFNWGSINIGWLCSDKQFNERLPHYLQQQGFMRN